MVHTGQKEKDGHTLPMNRHLLVAIGFIFLSCIFQCSKNDKKPLHSYAFNNSFGLPDAIVDDIFKNAFNHCISMTYSNSKGLSELQIDSICKCATIGIPFKRYIKSYSLPLCSLVCGKPFSSYCLPKYNWRIPILMEGRNNLVLEYQKDFIRKPFTQSGDTIWRWMGSEHDDRQIRVVNYWYSLKNKVPVFIEIPADHIILYTIPGFENDIFGILPSPWADTSFQNRKTLNPCLVFDSVRAILSKNNRPFKPIAKLPDAYKNFNQTPRDTHDGQ